MLVFVGATSALAADGRANEEQFSVERIAFVILPKPNSAITAISAQTLTYCRNEGKTTLSVVQIYVLSEIRQVYMMKGTREPGCTLKL